MKRRLCSRRPIPVRKTLLVNLECWKRAASDDGLLLALAEEWTVLCSALRMVAGGWLWLLKRLGEAAALCKIFGRVPETSTVAASKALIKAFWLEALRHCNHRQNLYLLWNLRICWKDHGCLLPVSYMAIMTQDNGPNVPS